MTTCSQAQTLPERLLLTVALLQQRGYAVTIAQLARWLVGGTVEIQDIRQSLEEMDDLCLSGDLVHARDVSASFLERCQFRQDHHHQHQLRYWPAVVAYTESLQRHCPQIQCITLAGSMSSGGFVASDDVDFNLFVSDGSRYTTYLMANLLALSFSFAHRQRPLDAHTRRLFLPKLMSVNVIWCDSDTRPFMRQDGAMALELLLSQPLVGLDYYQQLLARNLWLQDYFPQLLKETTAANTLSQPLTGHPLPEKIARTVTYLGWRWVMWTRRHNPEALARVAYVRKCQSPYALFED